MDEMPETDEGLEWIRVWMNGGEELFGNGMVTGRRGI